MAEIATIDWFGRWGTSVFSENTAIFYPCKLHGTELKSASSAKYFGISLSRDLNWKTHVTSKANNTLEFIRRNIKTRNTKLMEKACEAYIRAELEYCSAIWLPFQASFISQIEMVQRIAARYILHNYDPMASVTKMLQELQWQTLDNRIIQSSRSLLFKIPHNMMIFIDHHHLNLSRKPFQYIAILSNTVTHFNSFVPRTIKHWNQLPLDLRQCVGLDSGLWALNISP